MSPSSAGPATPTASHRPRTQVALVTAELRNQLVVVSLPGGRVVRRIPVAPDPKTVSAAPGGPVAVVSPGSGTVTVFGAGLRRVAVFRDFRSPQLATFTPDGEYLLVTDAAAGTLTSIELARMRVVGRVAVGTGAHHLAVSPDGRRAWVALGETANTMVVVDVADPRHMRVLRRLHPGAQAHDLAFDPDGRTVWVSSASQPYVSVYGAASGRLLDTVPGRPRATACAVRGRARLRDEWLRRIDRDGRSRPSHRRPARRVALRLVQPCIGWPLACNDIGAEWRGHGTAGHHAAAPRPNDGRIGRAIRGSTVALIYVKPPASSGETQSRQPLEPRRCASARCSSRRLLSIRFSGSDRVTFVPGVRVGG